MNNLKIYKITFLIETEEEATNEYKAITKAVLKYGHRLPAFRIEVEEKKDV